MREIEIKLRVNDLRSLEKKLKERGCVLSTPIRQLDTVYTRGNNVDVFAGTKEGNIVIRIRRQDDKAELNLKQQRSGELDNIECESKIDDPEAVHQILLLLGWQPQVEVKKIRRKGKLGIYEICLDQVEELGNFVELEKLTADDADPQEVRGELICALEDLGLSRADEEQKGYDTQIYHLSNNNKDVFQNVS